VSNERKRLRDNLRRRIARRIARRVEIQVQVLDDILDSVNAGLISPDEVRKHVERLWGSLTMPPALERREPT
jgi:ATP:corrinoid adenosyltransferase